MYYTRMMICEFGFSLNVSVLGLVSIPLMFQQKKLTKISFFVRFYTLSIDFYNWQKQVVCKIIKINEEWILKCVLKHESLTNQDFQLQKLAYFVVRILNYISCKLQSFALTCEELSFNYDGGSIQLREMFYKSVYCLRKQIPSHIAYSNSILLATNLVYFSMLCNIIRSTYNELILCYYITDFGQFFYPVFLTNIFNATNSEDNNLFIVTYSSEKKCNITVDFCERIASFTSVEKAFFHL